MRTSEKLKSINKLSKTGVLLAIFIILSTLAVTYYYKHKIASLSAYNQSSFQALQTSYEAELHLRTQIQEWKNILIRGHNEQEYTHYLHAMKTHASAFREKIEALSALLRLHKRLDKPIRMQIETLLRAHIALEEAYLGALNAYALQEPLAYQHIDALVRGKDREIPQYIGVLNTQLLDQSKTMRARTLHELKNMNFAVGMSVFIALLVILYTTRTREELSQSTTMFSLIAEHTNDGMVVFEKGKIIYESPGHIRLLGRTLLGSDRAQIFALLHPEDRERIAQRVNTAIQKQETSLRNTYRALHADGHYIYKDDNLTFEYDASGKPFRTFVIVRDVTEERLKDLKIVESEERYRTFVELSSDLIFLKDKEFRFLIANKNMAAFFGKPIEDIIGLSDFELMPYETAQQCRQSDMNALELDQTIISEECIAGRTYETTKYPLMFKGERCVAGVIRDVTEQNKDKEQIYQLAHYHPLTKLPNRRLFLDRLEHAVETTKHNGLYGGILLIDVDHFKIINDTWGHSEGDALLQMIKERLNAILHPEDTLAHLGSDEFMMMCEGCSDSSLGVAQKIVERSEQIGHLLSAPYLLGAMEYRCTVSIGATLLEPSHKSASTLMKEVEIALHHAKDEGRNRMCFFENTMQEKVSQQFLLEGALRKGIENNAFELYYQSQVDASMHLLGAEALIRWHHEGRLVPPNDFIPLLESTGLIIEVGKWVIEEGCKTLEKWAQEPSKAHVTLAINVSPKQFADDGFISSLHMILGRYRFNPSRLKIELTENLFLDNTQASIDKMNLIRSLGIGLSLDDFGTGYASLSYLKRIPITQLKIDQSFVRDVLEDENDAMIIRMIIGVAHQLGVGLIAEGVETHEQMQWLHVNHCESFQGYYIDKPQTLAMFEKRWEHFNGFSHEH